MNKLNKVGCQMIEYKTELNKDYPTIVINSLLSMVDRLAADEIIDVDIHFALKEKDINIDSLKELLLTKDTFVKTHEELFVEYEEIRKKVNSLLDIEDDDDETIKTISSVSNEKIAITKEFVISEDFIKEYFYIESDSDYESLIKRKGFIEKFAILRLEKIFRDFKSKENINSSLYELINSNVFFEAERNLYGIHLLFNIPIENLDDGSNISAIIQDIKQVIDNSIEYFNSRMTI